MINTFAAHSPVKIAYQLMDLGVTDLAARKGIETTFKIGRPVRLLQTPGYQNVTVAYLPKTGIYTVAWL